MVIHLTWLVAPVIYIMHNVPNQLDGYFRLVVMNVIVMLDIPCIKDRVIVI